MPIMLEDMESVVEDVRDAVKRMRALRESAYRLALDATKLPQYADDPEFKEHVDAVLKTIVGGVGQRSI